MLCPAIVINEQAVCHLLAKENLSLLLFSDKANMFSQWFANESVSWMKLDFTRPKHSDMCHLVFRTARSWQTLNPQCTIWACVTYSIKAHNLWVEMLYSYFTNGFLRYFNTTFFAENHFHITFFLFLWLNGSGTKCLHWGANTYMNSVYNTGSDRAHFFTHIYSEWVI